MVSAAVIIPKLECVLAFQYANLAKKVTRAEKLTDRICGISDTAAPHIRQQAEAYKLAIYNVIVYYIKQAINSERCTMRNLLEQQGHEDLAKILKEL